MAASNDALPRSSRTQRVLKWLGAFAATVAFWTISLRVAGGLGPFLVVLTLVINVIVHEAAHALMAWVAGHHVHVISVGKVAFFPRMWRLTFKYPQNPDHLGHVIHSPKTDSSGGRDWDGWITAAGPISNFVLAALGIVGVAILHYQHSRLPLVMLVNQRTDGSGALGLFACVSMLIGFLSLAAWPPGNDGEKLMRRQEGYRPSEAARRLAKLYAFFVESTDTRRWDENVFRQVEQDTFEGEDARLRDHLLVSRYLQFGDVHALKRLLRKSEATQNCTDPYLVQTYAFAIALVDRNGDIAGQWLDRVPDEYREGFGYWRAMAVVRAAGGDRDGARAAVAEARKADATGDEDDVALFAAIEAGAPLPVTFVKSTPLSPQGGGRSTVIP